MINLKKSKIARINNLNELREFYKKQLELYYELNRRTEGEINGTIDLLNHMENYNLLKKLLPSTSRFRNQLIDELELLLIRRDYLITIYNLLLIGLDKKSYFSFYRNTYSDIFSDDRINLRNLKSHPEWLFTLKKLFDFTKG